MKISRRLYDLTLSLSIGFVMSVFMSFAILLLNAGFFEGFFAAWLGSFATAFAISVPISIVAIPLTVAALQRVFEVQERSGADTGGDRRGS